MICKVKELNEEQRAAVISILKIKGFLNDNAEIDLVAVRTKFAEQAKQLEQEKGRAGTGASIDLQILEGELKQFNPRIVSMLKELCKNFEREMSLCHSSLDNLKHSIAKSAQQVIYSKIRGEILMPMADKPIGMISTSITNKMQETLAKYSKGGALTDALVDAEERMKVRDAGGAG